MTLARRLSLTTIATTISLAAITVAAMVGLDGMSRDIGVLLRLLLDGVGGKRTVPRDALQKAAFALRYTMGNHGLLPTSIPGVDQLEDAVVLGVVRIMLARHLPQTS